MANVGKVWNGTAWVDLGSTATFQSAGTATVGVVQLTDSTSSTSITTAATPNSVKSAYDLASAAIPKNTVTAAGDIIYASGSATPERLAIGTANHVLTVGTAGVPTWAASGGGYWVNVTGAEAGTALGLTSRAYAVTNVGSSSTTIVTTSGGTETFSANATKRIAATSDITSVGVDGGSTWTAQTAGYSTNWIFAATYMTNVGLFVAGGNGGTAITSPDGVTWTARTSQISTYAMNAAAYGNGTAIIAGGAGRVSTSTTGTAWTSRTSGFGATNDVMCAAYGNSLFVIGGQGPKLSTSPDGITWTSRTLPATAQQPNGLGYGNGVYIVVGYNDYIATSTDGATWTKRTSANGTATKDLYAVGYGNGTYVIGGQSGCLQTSTDGTTWTLRTEPTVNTIRSIWYANGLFVLAADNGTIMTSTDGITWTSRTSQFSTSDVRSVTANSSTFLAVGHDGKASTSPGNSVVDLLFNPITYSTVA